MNAGHLVSRLAMIEQDPEIVWKALCENFGSDFFVDQIEEEFGVSNESSEKLKREIDIQLKSIQGKFDS